MESSGSAESVSASNASLPEKQASEPESVVSADTTGPADGTDSLEPTAYEPTAHSASGNFASGERASGDEAIAAASIEGQPTGETDRGMQDYYQLQTEILVWSLALSAVIFMVVWFAASLPTALNYGLGAIVGVIYLKLLAREVEQIGRGKSQLSKTRFALFIVVFVAAVRIDRLEILPIFLGFLTYKAALILHALRELAKPNS